MSLSHYTQNRETAKPSSERLEKENDDRDETFTSTWSITSPMIEQSIRSAMHSCGKKSVVSINRNPLRDNGKCSEISGEICCVCMGSRGQQFRGKTNRCIGRPARWRNRLRVRWKRRHALLLSSVTAFALSPFSMRQESISASEKLESLKLSQSFTRSKSQLRIKNFHKYKREANKSAGIDRPKANQWMKCDNSLKVIVVALVKGPIRARETP